VTWFKVDDKFHGSEEVMSIPLAQRAGAIGLWTLAGAWSSDHLKNGFVPVTHLESWGGSVELAETLVTAKLWTRKRKVGYEFRNWEKWQITREQVEANRERERDKKAGWRAAKAAKSGDGHGGVPGDIEGSPGGVPSIPTRPDPTRPITPKGVTPRTRGTRIPDQFIVTADMRRWATTGAPAVDVDRSTEKFVNHWRSSTRNATKLDWTAAWRNWLMNDADRNTSKPSPTERAQRTVRLATEIDPKELEQ
jgi:hypothetical protein